MDAMDTAILAELKHNARASASEIGRRVSLSVPAVAERVRKLERAGIIERYTVQVNRGKTGFALLAFLLVRVVGMENVNAFRDAAIRHACVLECHHVTGTYDYLLKVAAEDVRALETFISQKLKTIRGVADTNTMVSLLTLKEEINP